MRSRASWLSAGLAIALLGCGPHTEQYTLPDQITDFSTLYESNCAGCHGRNGRDGAAHPLNDPLYVALVGKEKLRDVIAKGVPGTAMLAFAQDAGGSLTDQQLTILTDQIEAQWARPHDFIDVALPAYSAASGDQERGAAVFRDYCASCHGDEGMGGPKGGAVVNPAYLALVSDQYLRTTVISGRRDQGMPDWRTYSSSHAMTAREISDVVAWLSAHRTLPSDLAKADSTKGGTNLP